MWKYMMNASPNTKQPQKFQRKQKEALICRSKIPHPFLSTSQCSWPLPYYAKLIRWKAWKQQTHYLSHSGKASTPGRYQHIITINDCMHAISSWKGLWHFQNRTCRLHIAGRIARIISYNILGVFSPVVIAASQSHHHINFDFICFNILWYCTVRTLSDIFTISQLHIPYRNGWQHFSFRNCHRTFPFEKGLDILTTILHMFSPRDVLVEPNHSNISLLPKCGPI